MIPNAGAAQPTARVIYPVAYEVHCLAVTIMIEIGWSPSHHVVRFSSPWGYHFKTHQLAYSQSGLSRSRLPIDTLLHRVLRIADDLSRYSKEKTTDGTKRRRYRQIPICVQVGIGFP